MVANCLMGGHTRTTHSTGGWTLDRVEINAIPWNMAFVQKKPIALGRLDKFKYHFTYSTDVYVEVADDVEAGKALGVIEELTWLLTFACASHVVLFGHELPDGSGLGRRQSVVGTTLYFRPPIDIRDGGSVKHFVETTFPQYRALRSSRK